MARKARDRTNVGPKSGPLNYFFLDVEVDGKPVPMVHKKLHINRGADQITTWCYPLGKRVAYTYSSVKKHKEPAFTTQEVAEMLNRVPVVLERAIAAGNISQPQFTYGLDENRNTYKYMWHESNIFEAHAFLSTVHKGRPRKDGKITPMKLPTLRELRAIIRQEQILYVKDEKGNFIPSWRAEDFS